MKYVKLCNLQMREFKIIEFFTLYNDNKFILFPSLSISLWRITSANPMTYNPSPQLRTYKKRWIQSQRQTLSHLLRKELTLILTIVKWNKRKKYLKLMIHPHNIQQSNLSSIKIVNPKLTLNVIKRFISLWRRYTNDRSTKNVFYYPPIR